MTGAVPESSGCGYDDYSYAEALSGHVVGLRPPRRLLYSSVGKADTLNTRSAYDDAGNIYQYASAADFCKRNEPGTQCTVFKGPPGIVQAVAYDTGFAALTSTGQVWTWGDGRFPECLCRGVTDERLVQQLGQNISYQQQTASLSCFCPSC